MKILIAEDNLSLRHILEAMLDKWGYEVTSAGDGNEAWQILQQHDSPPLLLLDWMMPGMDGIEICRRLREKSPGLPKYVMLLTCRGHTDDIVEGLAAGANDYITKPFEAEELRARVQVGERYIHLQSALAGYVSELRLRSTELSRTNRALKILHESGQALFRATSESVLLNEICRICVETGGYRMIWIGYLESGAQQRIAPVAEAGYELGALETMRLNWGDTDLSGSPAGSAIRSGRPVILRNIFNDPSLAYRRPEAASRGYASLMALPLVANDETLGILSIYAKEPDMFDPDEVRLLARVANDLAYGIVALRMAEEKIQALEALQYERDQAQQYLDVAGVLMVALTPSGEIAMINRKGCEILGYNEKELLGRNWFETCIPQATRITMKAAFNQLMAGHGNFVEQYEQSVVSKQKGERILAIHTALLGKNHGKTGGILISGEDITDRKKMELALRESEENYRALFDKMLHSTRVLSAYKSEASE